MFSSRAADFGILRSPREVVFSRGALSALPRFVAGFGHRAFVCVDPFLATSPTFAEARKALRAQGTEVVEFSQIAPELPLTVVTAATSAARAFVPDVLVGFGGGSAIDLAKLVALGLATDRPLSEYYGENLVPSGLLPIIAIPTTSGTGSEVTPVAVVADPEHQLKVGISSPQLIPQVALVDPELTYTCPPSVTAFSGIDALTHAIEAYSSRARVPDLAVILPVFVGANRVSGLLALEAVSAIGPHLRRAVASPMDVEARTEMSYGSMIAGLAFGAAGTHLSHALQYPIGDATKTPHGLGVGLFLPYVMEACLPSAAEQFARIGTAMGVQGDGTRDIAINTIREIVDLRLDIGVPHTLAEIGIEEGDLDRLASQASTVGRLVDNAPVDDPRELILPIMRRAFHGTSDIFGDAASTQTGKK